MRREKRRAAEAQNQMLLPWRSPTPAGVESEKSDEPAKLPPCEARILAALSARISPAKQAQIKIATLAADAGISIDHASKVLRALRRKGLIASTPAPSPGRNAANFWSVVVPRSSPPRSKSPFLKIRRRSAKARRVRLQAIPPNGRRSGGNEERLRARRHYK